MRVKLLFVGLDGLDGKWFQQNKSAAADRIGTSGIMKSIPPFHSGPCWASMYTGLNPEDHGIASGGWTRGILYSNHIKAPTIWEQLENVGVFNMPMTWPPRRVDGWMVSGFPCIEAHTPHGMTYPRELEKYLPLNLFEDFPQRYWPEGLPQDYMSSNYVSDMTSLPLRGKIPMDDGFHEMFKRIMKSRLSTFRRIYRDYPVDAAAICYTFPDRAGHFGLPFTPDLLDEVFNDVLQAFDYEKLIMVSDHGFEDGEHSVNAFYLTNFGAEPKRLTDVYDIAMEAFEGE